MDCNYYAKYEYLEGTDQIRFTISSQLKAPTGHRFLRANPHGNGESFSKRPTFTFLKKYYLPLYYRYFTLFPSGTVLCPPAQRISEFWKDESQGALFLFQDFCVINESRVCNICFYFCKQIRTDDQSLSRGEREPVSLEPDSCISSPSDSRTHASLNLLTI